VPETFPGLTQSSREAGGIYSFLKGFAGWRRAIELEILPKATCEHSYSQSAWSCPALPSSAWQLSFPRGSAVPVPSPSNADLRTLLPSLREKLVEAVHNFNRREICIKECGFKKKKSMTNLTL